MNNSGNNTLKPLFEMAKVSGKDTGLKNDVAIGTKSAKHFARVKFDPCNGEKDMKKWPYVRVHDLWVDGEFNQKKVDIDSILYWTAKNRANIIRVFNKEINLDLFKLFLRFSKSTEDTELFLNIEKECSGLPLEIWFDDCNYFNTNKMNISIICMDDEDNFVGVVNVIDPKQSIFIQKYEKYANEISEWVRKWRTQIINVSLGKIDASELYGDVCNTYAIRNL